MSGAEYMIFGGVILFVSTAGLAAAEWLLGHRKKQIKEQTYQIYD